MAEIRSWQRAKRGALTAGTAATGVATYEATALVLLDDVELLFVEHVGDIERVTSTRRARVGAQLVLFRFEMTGERLTPGGLRFLLRGGLGLGFLGRFGSLLEGPPLLALDGRRRGRRRLWRRTRLALLALRHSEQLGDTLVEACELLDQLGDLLTLRSILSSQRFQLVHRRVQITLGDLCRSSSLLFRAEAAGTSRGALR